MTITATSNTASYGEVLENQVEGVFDILNDRAFNQEIDIAVVTINREKSLDQSLLGGQSIGSSRIAWASMTFPTSNGTRTILIEGYGYRIPKHNLIEFITFYGTIVFEAVEQLFVNGCDSNADDEGTNHTGTFVVKVQL